MHDQTSIADATGGAAAICESVGLELVDPDGDTIALDADFVYRPSDPYAVTIVFRSDTGDVEWTFARDLLVHGLFEPTGEGDVRVWPSLDADGRARVMINLVSPEGGVLLHATTRVVSSFVLKTTAAVALGAEGAHADVDGEVRRLLAH